MASANINVSGLWKNVKQIYSNVGGTWQSIKSGWVNVGGLWKQFFSSGAYSDSGTTVSSTYSSYNSVFTPYITGTTSHWQNAVSLDYRIQKDPGSGFTTVAGPYTFCALCTYSYYEIVHSSRISRISPIDNHFPRRTERERADDRICLSFLNLHYFIIFYIT
mgnify:CR=1 FL=1